MKRLEFHISYICSHKCIFCSEAERIDKFSKNPLSIVQIKAILIDRRKKWFDHINFTWWEPTIIPWFLDLLEFTKKLWYKIYVWTNWTMFNWEEFSKKALKYIDELSLSVHWFDEKSCFKQTWLKNHFHNFSKIIENINKYKVNNFFFLNIVINKYNYKNVEQILDFVILIWYNFHQVLISNIAPEWKAKQNYKDLSFNLNDFKGYVDKIIEKCERNNKIIRFFWIPICVLREENKEYSNDLYWEERHTIERFIDENWKLKLIDIYSPDNSRERAFMNKCNSCKYKNKPCTWVFEEYLKYYDF